MRRVSVANAASQFVKANLKPTLDNYAYRRALFESLRLQPQLLFPISVRHSARSADDRDTRALDQRSRAPHSCMDTLTISDARLCASRARLPSCDPLL